MNPSINSIIVERDPARLRLYQAYKLVQIRDEALCGHSSSTEERLDRLEQLIMINFKLSGGEI